MLSVMMINKTEALLLLCPNACGKKKIDKSRLVNLVLKKQTDETKINGLLNTSVNSEVWNSKPGLFESWIMPYTGKIIIQWIAWYMYVLFYTYPLDSDLFSG